MKKKLIISLLALIIIIAFGACEKETKVNDIIENKAKKPVSSQDKKENDKEETDSKEPSDANDPTESKEPTDYTPLGNEEVNIDIVNPVLMDTPPFSYYISQKVIDANSNSIKLSLISSETNEIIDDENWFIDNNLSINTYSVPNSFRSINGNLPNGIDTIWDRLIITAAFYDDNYIYSTYGNNFSEGYILNIYDIETLRILYTIDFSSYNYSPDYIDEDYDYIQQKINWAEIKNNILYISHSHNTYAKSSNNMNAYITAIDLSDMNILWRTDALVSNSNNFLIIEDVIISGYGFTDEPDYLYQININTGETLDTIPLKTAATYIIKKDQSLFVRTYNTNYVFDIIP